MALSGLLGPDFRVVFPFWGVKHTLRQNINEQFNVSRKNDTAHRLTPHAVNPPIGKSPNLHPTYSTPSPQPQAHLPRQLPGQRNLRRDGRWQHRSCPRDCATGTLALSRQSHRPEVGAELGRCEGAKARLEARDAPRVPRRLRDVQCRFPVSGVRGRSMAMLSRHASPTSFREPKRYVA